MKDIIILQNQVQTLIANQENYVKKGDLDEYVKNKERISRTQTRQTDVYVNKNRGGFCLQDSYDYGSGPMGLLTGLEGVASPNSKEGRRFFEHLSPSHASHVPVISGQPISVALDPAPAQQLMHVEAHRGQEAHRGNTSDALNINSKAQERTSEKVSSRNHEKNENEGEWVRVVKRKRTYRFKGMRGSANVNAETKLKAAESMIPLFIYNVSKENDEKDVADYVYDKTQITIKPEKINTKTSKVYSSFKFYIPSSKLSLFTNNELWPEGIYFRKYILFRHDKKATVNREKNT